LAQIIHKDRLSSRFFAAICRVVAAYGLVMCPVEFGSGTSIALPAVNEDHVTIT